MNKIAVVTGATGGIGKAIAVNLFSEGYIVIAMYNKNQAEAEKLKKDYNIECFQVDITDSKAIVRTTGEIIKKYHHIDLLVNNAGISQQKLFTDLTEEDIDIMLDTNLKGAMLLTKAAVPFMVERKSGKIINISSVWGVYGGSCEVHYSASKAGIIGFTKALSRELGLSNITVNCIAPGFIDTDMNRHLSAEDVESFISGTSLHKIGKPEDVANLVGFLASDKADYITGQAIGVDGGI